MLGDELVHEDAAVMVDYPARHAAVVELVPQRATATGIELVEYDESLFVAVFVAMAFHGLTARRLPILQITARVGHRSSDVEGSNMAHFGMRREKTLRCGLRPQTTAEEVLYERRMAFLGCPKTAFGVKKLSIPSPEGPHWG